MAEPRRVSGRGAGSMSISLQKKYGGGGHMNAAGCLFQFSSDKAQMVLLEDLRLFLKNQID